MHCTKSQRHHERLLYTIPYHGVIRHRTVSKGRQALYCTNARQALSIRCVYKAAPAATVLVLSPQPPAGGLPPSRCLRVNVTCSTLTACWQGFITIMHSVPEKESGEHRVGSTLQLGDFFVYQPKHS